MLRITKHKTKIKKSLNKNKTPNVIHDISLNKIFMEYNFEQIQFHI